MRRLGRWILGFLLVIVGALAALYGYTSYRFAHRYDIASRNLTLPTDSASLERGHRLATTLGKCGVCHEPDLGGRVFIDGMPFAYVETPNLTGPVGPGHPPRRGTRPALPRRHAQRFVPVPH